MTTRRFTLPILALTVAFTFVCGTVSGQNEPTTPTAEELEELKKRFRKLEERIEELEGREDSAQGPLRTGGKEPTAMPDKWVDDINQYLEKEFPVKASYGSKGFRLETRDGNWQLNLQFRAQLRFTTPFRGNPRQVDDFQADIENTFEARRLRMKIGGHGFRKWLKYYFEVDLQPTRDTDDRGSDASSRVIDWRIDLAKWKAFGVRVGQWKIDYNRERVDSSGRQQFVERSIVNRIFTVDRQMGVGLRGHLFIGTPAELRYYLGAFTGEGRGVQNDDSNLMYVTRLQWNFFGRDLPLKQTDVERTEHPTASFAVGGATHEGTPTRWSSSGAGNLDGFERPSMARDGQFKIYQAVAELAFKWQGFSTQNELHWKSITDKSIPRGDRSRRRSLYGFYTQAGFFPDALFDCCPEELEVAARYAWVKEPNEMMRIEYNEREEYTVGLNWFFAGHRNKITLDYSYLTLDDDVIGRDMSANRFRLQWDISF